MMDFLMDIVHGVLVAVIGMVLLLCGAAVVLHLQYRRAERKGRK